MTRCDKNFEPICTQDGMHQEPFENYKNHLQDAICNIYTVLFDTNQCPEFETKILKTDVFHLNMLRILPDIRAETILYHKCIISIKPKEGNRKRIQ